MIVRSGEAAVGKPQSVDSRRAWASVLVAGAAAGLTDLLYASSTAVMAGRDVGWPWRAVAHGWFFFAGPDPAVPLVTLGIVTHFGISMIMMAAFAVAAHQLPQLYCHWRLAAVAYGLTLYGIMYGLVIPVRWPELGWRWSGWSSVADIVVHMLFALVGVFILVRARRQRATIRRLIS